MSTGTRVRKQLVIRSIERQVRQAVIDGRLWSDPLIAISDDLHTSGVAHLARRDYAKACDRLLTAFFLRWLICGDGSLRLLLLTSHLALSLDLNGCTNVARELREEALRRFLIFEAANKPGNSCPFLH